MPSFNAGNIEATASVDRTQFLQDLRDMRADADKFTAKPISVKATLDDTEVKAKLAALKADFASARNDGPTISVGLDTAGVRAQFDALKATLGSTSSSNIRVSVEVAGSASALSALAALDDAVHRLDGRDISIRVSVSSAAANSALADTAARAAALGNLSPTISPNVNPSSTSAMNQLNSAFSDLKKSVPSLIQAVLPLAPALLPIGVAALAAVAGLTSLAVAGGGALAVFAGATLGAVKASQAHATALAQANTALASAKSAYDSAASAAASSAQAVTQAKQSVVTAQAAVGDAVKAAAQQVVQAKDAVVTAQQAQAKAVTDAATQVQNAKDAVVQAEQEESKAVTTAAQQVASAREALVNAQQAVGVAAQQAAKQAQDAKDAVVTALQQQAQANQGVTNAEFALSDAQHTEYEAQQALTQARVDAKRAIEDMNASLADAQLSERGDKLAVQEAQLALNQANAAGSKATTLQRQEAQLAYDEAKQHLTEQSTATKRAAADTAAANKAGVNGSKQVAQATDAVAKADGGIVSAAQQLAAAQQTARNASEATAKAQQNVTTVQQTGARQVATAQQAAADAARALTTAQVNGAASVASAQQNVVKAQKAVTTAQVNGQASIQAAQAATAKAVAGVAQAQQDGAKQVAAAQAGVKSAQEGVASAEQNAAKAGQAAAAAATALAAAQTKQNAASKLYAPIERELTGSLSGLKTAYNSFIASTEKTTLTPVITVIHALAAALPHLIPLVKAVGPIAQDVANAFAHWVNGGGLDRAVAFLTRTGVPVLHSLELGLRSLLGVGGNLIRTFAPMAISLAGGFQRIMASLAGWAAGDNGGPGGFSRFLALAEHYAPSVESFFSKLGTFTGHLGQTMQILGPLSLSLASALLSVANAIPIPVLTVLVGLLLTAKDAMLTYRVAVVAVRLAQVAMSSTTWLLTGAILAMPITWIVIGIAALAAGIVYLALKTQFFQTLWRNTWAFAKAVAADVWGWLTGKWGWLIAIIGPVGWLIAIGTHWSEVWGTVKAVAGDVWGWIERTFKDFTNWVTGTWNTSINFIERTWDNGWAWVKKTASGAWDWIKTTFGNFTSWISSHWDNFLNGIKGFASNIWGGIMTAVRTFKSGFEQAFSDIVTAVGKTWTGIKKITAVPINFVMKYVYGDGIKKIWDNTAGKIGLPDLPATPPPIKYAAGGIVPGVGVGDRVNTMLTPGERVLSRDQVASVGGHGVLNQIFGAPTTNHNGNTQYLSGGGIGGFIGGALKGAVNLGKKAAGAVGGAVGSVASKGFDIAKGAVGWGLDKVKNLAGDVVWDIAKPALNLLKAAVVKAAPAPKTIPEHFADALIGDIGSFLKGTQNNAKAQDANGGGQYTAAGPVSIFEGVKLDAITITQLKKAFALAGGGFGLSQGSYSTGVAASAGTHSGGGALDVAGVGSMSDKRQIAVVKGLREAGFAAWRRTPAEGFVDHIHAILEGDPTMSPQAAAQIPDYFAHKDGLAGHAPDTNPIDVAAGWFGSSAPNSGGVSFNASGGVKQWDPQIKAALKLAGLPVSFVAQVEKQIQSESGGNPNAINLTDVNAQEGNPSKGLLQVIQPTFDAYAGSLKSKGINDPEANIYAAIKYALATYGPTMMRGGMGLGTGHAYANGTNGAASGWALVGEQGPEMINLAGGETILPNSVTQQFMRPGMGGYAGGTLADEIAGKLAGATKTTAGRQSTVNKLQDTYDTQHLNAVYAKNKYVAAADAAEAKLTAAKLAQAKHLLTQAKQSEAQLKKDYTAATKASSDAAKALTTASKATATNFQQWLAAEQSTITTQLTAATQVRSGYLTTAQGTAPSLTGLTTFGAIASAYSGATTSLTQLGTNVQTLKGRGASPALIDTILGMAPADALALTGSLVHTDSAGLGSANKAFAAFGTETEAFATQGANVTANYTNLSKASAALGTIKIETTSPSKVEIKMPDGTTVLGTMKTVETKVEKQVAKLLKAANTSK